MEWDLSVLYTSFDDPKLEEDFARADRLLKDDAVFFNNLDPNGDTAAQLEEARDRLEATRTVLGNLGSFIHLTLATDATNERANGLTDRLMNLSNRSFMSSAALSRYLGQVTDLEDAISRSPKLKEIAFFLRENQAQAAHQLPAELQTPILQMQMTGGSAWSNLRGMLDATMKVPMTFRGESRVLALSEVRNMAYSPDAELRRTVYEAELAAYPAIEQAMAACLNGIKGESLTLLPYRHYDSLLDQTLRESRMERKTLDALFQAIREYQPMFVRYLRAKARFLGHTGGLPFYDLFAPIELGEPRQFTVEEARTYLVDTMRRFFSDKMADFIDNAFEHRWLDTDPHPGKRGGAFCSGLASPRESRILTNFDGSLSDVLTMAHELGHGYHNMCQSILSPLNSRAPMPLAETASIFNETLVGNAALAFATPEEALGLLQSTLQETTQTCIDILSRFLFEYRFIEARKTHTLSVEEIKALMLEAQKEAYGEGLDPEYLHPYMWACKSHYYSTGRHFYNFPYAFGSLFGLGVYAQFEKKGRDFLPEYDALLRLSGMDTIENVTNSVGIDVTTPEFWRSSLEVVSAQCDRFCKLVDEHLAHH